MGMFETYIYYLTQEKCKLYLTYIDDIFLIWTGTLNELNKFVAKINQLHLSIKFDLFKQQCKFLRYNSKKYFMGKLSTTLFKKETDCQTYLHKKPEHLEPLKRSIP